MADRSKRIFCNRTLNLRSIRAIGYDMDYTLIHYHVERWETHAYAHARRRFVAEGWPVDHLEFDPSFAIRGLIIDTELGNVLKANRFGFVKRAFHGTREIPFEEMRKTYSRVIVDLADSRYRFLNTLFSLSETCLYAQLVDLLDEGRLAPGIGYTEVHQAVRRGLDELHMEGELKGEIVAAPDEFVDLDPDLPLALLDQRHANKHLLLITNSEWSYTDAMMTFAFDRYLPGGMRWRDLFDLIIVQARKPDFFLRANPAFEIVDDQGLLRPITKLLPGHAYLGGDARQVQECFDLHGDEILFVGDHIFSDLHVSKSIQRWRTALVLRELEGEVEASRAFEAEQAQLEDLMARKEALEAEHCNLRIRLVRREKGYGPSVDEESAVLRQRLEEVWGAMKTLDLDVQPLAAASAALGSARWGSLMRSGNDKSHLARQIERYADVYLARVSDFLHHTPFAYLRSARGSLPHDL